MCTKMSVTLLFMILIFKFVDGVQGSRSSAFNFHEEDAEKQQKATEELVKRILPDYFLYFKVSVVSNFSQDSFQIFSSGNGTVFITGRSGVDVASGLNYYLKYYCYCQISWQNKQLNLPKQLPAVNVTISYNDRFRYYQNICTSSYSFVWWNWSQWEKHIDWMALNGYNLVLAPNGQEFIWNLIYKEIGMTQQEIDEHFTGPAFLAWNRMGNLRKWGGPLSEFWHNRSFTLQTNTLSRMRSLGIVPVLPGFAGHVPRAFKRLFPTANLTKMEEWSNFNDSYSSPYLLDANDGLFETIGEKYYKNLNKFYGVVQNNNKTKNTMYSADVFNEMSPVSTDESYISSVGSGVYKTMVKNDPGAIWLMQGWLFVYDPFWTKERAKALVTSVPFEPIRARNETTMIGVGITAEGINQNYVIYDLMSEMSWRDEPVDLTEWFDNYSRRRYGQINMSANQTWQILKSTLYNFTGTERLRGKYSINSRPSLHLKDWMWYENSDLFHAFETFLDASDSLADSETYKHDIVDLTRQVLQILGDEYHKKIVKAYKSRYLIELKYLKQDILDLFTDLDLILASNENFLLGKWLKDAKNVADNPSEIAQFEYNARNQITLWGPNGEIVDYANKQWAGVVADYFEPRWEIYLSALEKSLSTGEAYNETETFEKMFFEVEQPFTISTKEYPSQATGNPVDIARYIRDKWTLDRIRKFNIEHEPDLRVSDSFISKLRDNNDNIEVTMLT
ncbi:alpha-N-acetylglucosaminidase isoform X2 [Agrilus planipennis]|uniref:Alpha-N-acetylglucosaminidase isoform X2 n=1 Tax=Agrilus planipennis TaxID=224129 RepID=A0A1W4WW58_AGRPL|nr:alpha-N-acetylglucosaminidase isoform X2 [Agrilus planipennis]